MDSDLEERAARREQDKQWTAEDRATRREERREEREEESAYSRKKMVRSLVSWIAGAAVVTVIFMVPAKAIDWSNCEDVCESNGDESYWKWGHGCYCKGDGDGDLYNPRDER